MACGTRLNLRTQDSTDLCPTSIMKDLYELIRDCDKQLHFNASCKNHDGSCNRFNDNSLLWLENDNKRN